jgi:hypothetical protein
MASATIDMSVLESIAKVRPIMDPRSLYEAAL